MPTEENKVTGTSTNPVGSGQTSSSSKQGDDVNLNEVQKRDTLDIDLNLDGIDIPENKIKENEDLEVDTLNVSDINTEKIADESEQINFSDINFSFDGEGDNIVESQDDFIDENIVEQSNENIVEQSNENIVEQVDDIKDAKSQDDWLLEEDKRVAELLPMVSDTYPLEGENLEIEAKPGLLNEEKIDTLDIPFVGPNEVDNTDGSDLKIDDLSDIFVNQQELESEPMEINEPEEKYENLNIVKEIPVENKIEQTDIKIDDLSDLFGNQDDSGSENLEANQLEVKEENLNIVKETPAEKNQNNELLVKNYGENVVENKAGYIVSDTGEFNGDTNNYVPNENDFNQITEILNSDGKGPVDMGSFEDTNVNKELPNSGNNIGPNLINNGINLDTMIANIDNNKNTVENLMTNPPIKSEINVENQSQNLEQANQTNVQMSLDNIMNTPLENIQTTVNNNLNTQNTTTALNNNQGVSNQNNVVMPVKSLKKKNKYSGVKIFVLIVLLLAGGFMILSKMYPEEISDIMSAIKNGNEASIEYIDNDDAGDILDEEVLTGEILDEEMDPDSLAAQLENGDDEIVGNDIGYSEDDVLNTGHGAADDTGLNVFETLDGIIDSDNGGKKMLLEQLNGYVTKGNEFNDWGRVQGNSTAMKYGTYIFTKAGIVIDDIENGLEIDNTKVDTYFAQFDVYLEKLSKLRNDTEGVNQDNSLDSQGLNDTNSEESVES